MGLVLFPPLFFDGRSCANQISFEQCTNSSILAEQSSKQQNVAYGDYFSTTSGIIMVVGMSCIIIASGLSFIRYLILCRYGRPTGLIKYLFLIIHARMLREIIEIEESEKLRTCYKWLNILIPALIIGGIFIMIFAYSF